MVYSTSLERCAMLIGLFCCMLLVSGSILHNSIMQMQGGMHAGYDAYKSADYERAIVETASPTNEKGPGNNAKVTSAQDNLSTAGEDHRERGINAQADDPTQPYVNVTFVNGPSPDIRVDNVTPTGGKNEITPISPRAANEQSANITGETLGLLSQRLKLSIKDTRDAVSKPIPKSESLTKNASAQDDTIESDNSFPQDLFPSGNLSLEYRQVSLISSAQTESSFKGGKDEAEPNDPATTPPPEEQAKNCSTCGGQDMAEETVKELRLSMFADLLRQKLRMPEFPEEEEASNETAPGLPSDLLQRMFQNDASNEETEEFFAIDDEILIPGEDVGAVCDDLNMTGCYTFDLKDKFTNAIAAASLWFNRSHDRTGRLRSQHMKVYEIEALSGVQKRIHLGRNDMVNKNGWISLNLTIPVRKWVEEGAQSKVLAIKCNYNTTGHSDGGSEDQFDYSSVLEIKYFKTRSEQRKKKNANCDPRTECCKRPLEVNFDAIDMHNIYRPTTLNVDFCYGYCDGVDQYSYNHTALKQRYRWVHNTEASLREQLKPCCVPLILKDTAIMVRENHDLVRKILNKVIVEKCGCL